MCALLGFSFMGFTSALTYQDGTDVQFTFNSTLSISLSDTDIIIGNLIPGQDDTSNAVDVVVNTNNLYGYTLTATVGSATKDYRDLRHTNGTASFASIDVNSDLSTLSGESSSVWGYTTSTNGTTWSNFSGLPKYDDTANTAELNVTDSAAEDSTTSFKIGAFAAEGQLAGDYTNVINFAVVVNGPPKQYIQDITSATCPAERTLVYDRRDEKPYYVQTITYGAVTKCWMTSNLDLAGGTLLYSDDSNVPDGYPRNEGTPYYTLPVSNARGFTNGSVANLYNSGNTICSNGTACYSYYNYAAATAGTNPSSGNSAYDICPSGWRLPTQSEYNELRQIYTTGSLLNGAPWYGEYGGNYGDNFADGGHRGRYWSSTSSGASSAYFLNYGNQDVSLDSGVKYPGYSIRCVAK